jgi:hypothetical protein
MSSSADQMARYEIYDSSSFDDSDLEDLLDDDMEQFVLLLAVKELQRLQEKEAARFEGRLPLHP